MKKHKASILVVTLFILGIIITTALAVSLAAIKQRSASLGSGKSTKAFQNADAGVEAVLSEIIRGNSTTVNGVCGVINGAGYKVELYDKDNNKLSCSSTESKGVIATIKSIGEGADQQTRAIEAVAAASTLEWENIDDFDNGWENYEGAYYDAQYAKDNRTGLVYLRGTVKNGSCDTGETGCTILNIPSGYRPVGGIPVFDQMGTNHLSWRVQVTTGGDVRAARSYSGTFPSSYLSLDGIVFATN